MNQTFQIDLSFEDVLERQSEIHEMNRSKVSKFFSNMKAVAALFGFLFLGYSLLMNRGATLIINEENYSAIAYIFSGLIAALVGITFGFIFFALNRISQSTAKKNEAKRYIRDGENKYLLHVEGESLRIEKSKNEEILIHLKELWTALPRPKFVLLLLGEERAAILPRFPTRNFDLWEHIEPILEPKAEPVAVVNASAAPRKSENHLHN